MAPTSTKHRLMCGTISTPGDPSPLSPCRVTKKKKCRRLVVSRSWGGEGATSARHTHSTVVAGGDGSPRGLQRHDSACSARPCRYIIVAVVVFSFYLHRVRRPTVQLSSIAAAVRVYACCVYRRGGHRVVVTEWPTGDRQY